MLASPGSCKTDLGGIIAKNFSLHLGLQIGVVRWVVVEGLDRPSSIQLSIGNRLIKGGER